MGRKLQNPKPRQQMELCSPAVRKGTDNAEIPTRADLGILEGGGGGDTLTEAVLAASQAGCFGYLHSQLLHFMTFEDKNTHRKTSSLVPIPRASSPHLHTCRINTH